MANICDFEMKIYGSEENIESFLKAMEQKGEYCMGRGAEIVFEDEIVNGKLIGGLCKWSVESALYDNANSMKLQKETGHGSWANINGFMDDHTFINIVEATEKWKLKIEIASWECGCEFSEHYIIDNGVVIDKGLCEYREIYDEETDEYISVGGFPHL